MKTNSILFSLLLFLFFTNSLSAQNGHIPEHETKKDKPQIPDKYKNPIGWVSDFDSTYTDSQRHVLDSMLQELDSIFDYEFRIVTIDTISMSQKALDSLAQAIEQTWNVGRGKIGGALLLIFADTAVSRATFVLHNPDALRGTSPIYLELIYRTIAARASEKKWELFHLSSDPEIAKKTNTQKQLTEVNDDLFNLTQRLIQYLNEHIKR